MARHCCNRDQPFWHLIRARCSRLVVMRATREACGVRIALIAAPFIAVPPAEYGGTELFVAQLAEGLKKANVEVVVYANGESTVDAERRWIYERSVWPIKQAEP